MQISEDSLGETTDCMQRNRAWETEINSADQEISCL